MKLKDFDNLTKERFTSEEIAQINAEAEKEISSKKRPTFQDFKEECLKDAKVKEEYELLCSNPKMKQRNKPINNMNIKHIPQLVICHKGRSKDEKLAIWEINETFRYNTTEIDCEYIDLPLRERLNKKMPTSCEFHQKKYNGLHNCVTDIDQGEGSSDQFACSETASGQLYIIYYAENYETGGTEMYGSLWREVICCPFCGYKNKG